jgi:hypothetical protein
MNASMNAGTLSLLLVATFFLCWYTAWGVGRYWTEAKIVGGWMRLVVGAGVVLAAAGFTWVYLTLLTALAVGVKFLTVEQAQFMFNLGYIAIGGPLLGSAAAIWNHTRILAFRRRVLGNAGYSAYSQLANAETIWWAASNADDLLGNILEGLGIGRMSRSAMTGAPTSGPGTGDYGGSGFLGIRLGGSDSGGGGAGGGDGDGLEVAVILFFVMLAILAVCGGILTTFMIVRHADRVHAVDVTRFLDVMNG